MTGPVDDQSQMSGILARLEDITGYSIAVYGHPFLSKEMVALFIEAMKDYRLDAGIRLLRGDPGEEDGATVYKRDLGSVPPEEILLLRYQSPDGMLALSPISGKPLSEEIGDVPTYYPQGVLGVVQDIEDQWNRILASVHVPTGNSVLELISQAAGSLGPRSTVVLKPACPFGEREAAYVFDGPYFASKDISLEDKLRRARENPLP